MCKILSLLILTVLCLTSFSQSNPTQYLEKNRYSFSIDTGFDKASVDTLCNKFKDFRLILQAEGGSHYLKFYNKLQLIWTKLLSEKLEMKSIFLEFGAVNKSTFLRSKPVIHYIFFVSSRSKKRDNTKKDAVSAGLSHNM